MRKYHFSEPSDNKQSQNIIQMPLSHFAGKNFWIFKATSLNRGRGIHVFNTLEQLYELIKQYSGSATGKKIYLDSGLDFRQNRNSMSQTSLKTNLKQEPTSLSNPNFANLKHKMNNFIIQKYIEKPYLI